MLAVDDCVILFADLQPSIVANVGTTPLSWIDSGTEALARVASILNIPILFSVVVEKSGHAHGVPSLDPYMVEQITFARECGSPFMDERFVAALIATGRKTLIIAGYATEAVTLFASLDAIKAGFRVVVALDAGGGASHRTEDAAVRRIERAGGTVTANVDIFMSWAPDFTTPTGRLVHDAMQKMIEARG